MLAVKYSAGIAAAVVALVQGALWYSAVFGGPCLRLRGLDPAAMADTRPPIGELAVELGRCLVVAYVLARFIVLLDVPGWIGAVQLAFRLWLGFQAMAITGSVIHEHCAWPLYAIHASDALVKTMLMAVILAAWR